MPTYGWRCTKCDTKVEMVLSVKEYDKKPDQKCKCETPEWVKSLGPTQYKRGPGWRGRKGEW